jgi:hypothetical protein
MFTDARIFMLHGFYIIQNFSLRLSVSAVDPDFKSPTQ